MPRSFFPSPLLAQYSHGADDATVVVPRDKFLQLKPANDGHRQVTCYLEGINPISSLVNWPQPLFSICLFLSLSRPRDGLLPLFSFGSARLRITRRDERVPYTRVRVKKEKKRRCRSARDWFSSPHGFLQFSRVGAPWNMKIGTIDDSFCDIELEVSASVAQRVVSRSEYCNRHNIDGGYGDANEDKFVCAAYNMLIQHVWRTQGITGFFPFPVTR